MEGESDTMSNSLSSSCMNIYVAKEDSNMHDEAVSKAMETFSHTPPSHANSRKFGTVTAIGLPYLNCTYIYSIHIDKRSRYGEPRESNQEKTDIIVIDRYVDR